MPPEARPARELKKLRPLIQKDLAAARKAEAPFYAVAGEKLWEAKANFEGANFEGTRGFYEWAAKTFKVSQGTIRCWMAYAVEMNGGRPFNFQYDTPSPRATRHFKEAGESRRMSNQVIDAGYKVMATKLHPDKGGSTEAMQRLNQVRARLLKRL